MNRLLVTGATGFLGMPCVARAAEEYEVHAVARQCGLSCSEGSPSCLSRVVFHICDLFNAKRVNELLATVRPTHLLHLAWIATPGVYWTSPENHTWVEASKHLLGVFAERGGKRAVVAGTCAEYDWTLGGTCDEFTTPTRPSTIYGQCKNELRAWCEARDLSVASARLFLVYGPREHPARLVPSVTRSLLAGEIAECSAGTQRRDYLHSNDVAAGLLHLLRSDITGPVNVGSGEAVTVRTVIDIIARTCGRHDLVRFGARPTPTNEPPLLVAAGSRLRDELGWRPRIGLEEGLRECVNWWRARRAA
jgi:nucleoside-diphosphate-sugar epimerase